MKNIYAFSNLQAENYFTKQYSNRISFSTFFLLLTILLFSENASWGQILIDPTGDGGFETGTTFANNGWTVVGSATTTNNQWVLNTGATGFSGARCAYITNATTGAPPVNTYSVNSHRSAYFYRDITIPSAALTNSVILTFNWKGFGESTFDWIRVWAVPTNFTPTYATTDAHITATGSAPSGRILLGTNNQQTEWQSALITIPNAYIGQSFRLVFGWRNDASTGTAPAGAIDNISLTYQSSLVVGKITGTTTIACGATTTLSSPVPTTTNGTVTTSGNLRTSTFTTVGTTTLGENFEGNVEVLVVAGGGGGGHRHAGGGGAGGVIYNPSFELTSNPTVTVGGGGAGSSGAPTGNNGGNSVFGSLTATGGGGGGTNGTQGASGGSGGGGSNGAVGGNGTAGQGNKGGNQGTACCNAFGAGGGGAGASGINSAAAAGTIGGVGRLFNISGSNVTYAGGGGGGNGANTTVYAGGAGGGGAGGTTSSMNGVNGTANTGGGGGGGGANGGSSGNGGNGGSGIVIVRYLLPTGGTWSSNNTAVATVNATTGVVTGVSQGTATITYTATNGSLTRATSTTVTVGACITPTISNFTPTSACSQSGATITINGSNLLGGTVTVNGISASVTLNTASQLQVTLPAGASGSGNIVVTTGGGSASLGTFTVNPLATSGDIQFQGTTQSICSGGTISSANVVAPTNGGSGTLSVVWYVGEDIGGGNWGNWRESTLGNVSGTTSSSNLNAAAGGGTGMGTSLTNYNPLIDFPSNTRFLVIRRGYNSNCGPCVGGCQDKSFIIQLNPLPQGNFTGNSICSGSNAQLTFTSSAGTGPFNIVYNSGSQNSVTSGIAFNAAPLNPSTSTNYTLTSVTDANGCVRSTGFTSGTATVNVTTTPSAPGTVSTSNVSCTALTLNWGAAANATGYEVQVSTASNFSNSIGSYNGSTDVGNVNTLNVTGLTSNTQYWIRVRARSGSAPCRSGWTNLTTTSVTTLTPSISYSGSPFSFCLGSTINNFTPTVVGSPTGYTISPSLPTGLSFNTSTGVISGTPSLATSSTLYTINSTGTCATSTTISIATNNPPTDVSAGFDASVCSGGSVQLNGSATAPPFFRSFSELTGGGLTINTSGNASVYPSTVNVSGLAGTISNIRVNLTNLTHSWPIDVDIVLFGPTGAHSIIMTDAIGGSGGISGRNYTFQIGATALGTSGFPASGTYGVVNGGAFNGLGTPSAVSSANLNNFVGTNPNGTWSLYVFDDTGSDGGSLGSWALEITTNAGPVTYSWSPVTFLSATNVANPTASNVTAGQTYTMTATANGCSVERTVNVGIRSIPAATPSNSGPVCAGGTVQLTASNLAPGGSVVTMNNSASDNIAATTHSGVLNNHTIEFWVNPNRTVVLHAEHNTGVIANLGAPTTEFSFAISPNQFGGSGCTPANVGVGVSVGTNGIEVVQHGPCHFPVTLSYSGAVSGWTHVAVVHISNVPYLYVNGNLVKVGMASAYPTFPNSSVSMNYGYFGGSIDNIRVWNLSRTASQIVTDMNREVPSVATGLIHNLPLNGNGTALVGDNAAINGSSYATPTFYTYTWTGSSAPSAGTNETQATSGLATSGNYTVVATHAGCSSGTASTATSVTVTNPTVSTSLGTNDFVWTGTTSTAWNTTSNWLQWNGSAYTIPAGFPNSPTANVILPTDVAGTCVPREARIGNLNISVNNLTGETDHRLLLNNANAVLNIYGTYQGGTWMTPDAGATVNYIGNVDQPIRTGTYSNLTTGGSGIKTLNGGNVTVNLTCTVGANSTLALDTRTLSLPNPGSPLVLNGSLSPGTGTVNYSSTTGDQNITPTTYYNLTTSGNPSTKALAGTTTVTNIVNIGAGVTFNAGSHTLNVSRLNTPFTVTGTFNPGTGLVNYDGGGNQNVNALTYHNLTISNSGIKTLAAGTTTVNGTLNLTGGTFAVAARTLILNGPYITGTVANMTTTSGSILELNCTGTGPFTLHNSTALGNLKINSSGQVYNLNSNMVISGDLNLEAGTLGVNTRTFTYTGSSITKNAGFIDATNTAGTMTFGANAAPLTLTVDLFTSNTIGNLTLNRAGGVTLGSSTTVANTLTLTDGTLTVGPNTFTMNGSTMTRTSGFIDASDASATLAFGNASLLTLPASVFSAAVNNMSLTGARVKASSDFTVNGTLSLNAANPDATNGLLDLVNSYGTYANTRTANSTDANNNLNSVILTLGPSASISGQGDVTGKIRRTSFSSNTPYSFGNQNMQLSFDDQGGNLPSQITVVATKGTEGLHVDKNGTHDTGPNGLIGGAAVQRMWQVLRTGGDPQVKFTVRFPYLDSELNGNNEANLVTWDHHIPYGGMTPHEHGKTSNNTIENWVELSNHGIGYLATENDAAFTKYWMVSQKVSADTLWLGAAGGGTGINWNVGINWSHGAVPASFTKVVVDPTIYNNQLTINGDYSAGTMEIKAGGVVNGGSGTLTLNGGPAENGGAGTWLNNGTFNAGTSTVVINNADATLAGNTRFHNLTINNGKKLTVQASSIDTIGGVFTNNGTFDAGTHSNTIVFAGTNQTIPQPNGNVSGYQNLTVAQSSGTAVAAEPLTVRGNFGVNNGTLNMSNNALEVKGNFTNNASITNMPNITLSGGAQQIGGSTITNFGNLTLSSGAGTTTLLQDIVVNGTLDVNAGETINASDKNIELTASGTPWVLNGTFTPSNSTVKYTASDATNIVGTTYYNLQSTGNATKTAQGNVTINNQLNLNASTLDMQSHTLSLTDLAISNSGKITADNAVVNLNNTAELTLPSGVFTSAVKDLNLNGADVTSSGNITMNGTLDLVGGNLEMGSNTLTMQPTSTWTRTSGKLDASNAKVVFKSPVFAVGVVDNALVKDLEFDRADGIGVNGNLEVSGELKLTAGVVDIAANTLKVNGTMQHTAGSIDADNGRMNFANNAQWTLPATFFNGNVKELEISGNGGIKLGSNLRVSDVLDLTQADIVTNNNVIEIGTGKNNPGVVNVNPVTNVKVVGKMRRWYNGQASSTVSSGIFPVGSPDDNRFVQINFNEANDGGYLDVEYKLGAPDNNYELPLTYMVNGLRRYIQNADQTGYWSITPYDENGNDYASMDNVPYTMKLRINNPSATANGNNLPDPPTMRIIRAKGNPGAQDHEDWTIGSEQASISALTAPSNANFDYLVTATLTGFSWFNIGGDNSTPLPVELISFSGNCSDFGNLIKWKTASENNSAYFEIQRSRDGEFWTSINQTPAAGFSMQELAYEFEDMSAGNEITYYRLKQVDISGDFKIYDPIAVACGVEGNVSITYPNPSAEIFTILIQQPELVGKANLQIVDSRGTVVKNASVQVEEGINQIRLTENFAPGIYYVTITNGKSQSPVLKHSIR